MVNRVRNSSDAIVVKASTWVANKAACDESWAQKELRRPRTMEGINCCMTRAQLVDVPVAKIVIVVTQI